MPKDFSVTFAEFWLTLNKKNGKLANCKRMQLAVDEFKRILKVAHDEGYNSGFESGRTAGVRKLAAKDSVARMFGS